MTKDNSQILKLIIQEFKKNQKSLNNSLVYQVDRDIKIHADKDLNNLINNILTDHDSYNTIFSEEDNHRFKANTDKQWIVDPIDGSYNLYKGIPLFTTSIALWDWKNDMATCALIYDHSNGDYVLYNGKHVYHNDLRLISPKNNFEIISSGISTYNPDKKNEFLNISKIAEDYKKVRMLGSASLSLMYLSLGKVDKYYEDHIKIWDVAAGIAICKALNLDTSIKFHDRETLRLEINAKN